MINNPLEQFQIIPIFSLKLGSLDFSITNSSLVLILALFILLFLTQLISLEKGGTLVPNRYQYILEQIYLVTLGMISDQVGKKKGEQFFPFIFSIFTFLLIVNLLGMVPYSFTATSHIIVTLTLALGVFIGVNIIMFREHGIKSFGFFLPAGAPFGLLPLLIAIEIVSFIIRPLTLSVRLFANMMSGHILLKVLLGFSWTMLMAGGGLFFLHFAVLGVVYLLIGLEFGVAMVQAYVFTLLTCIYINDAINLH